MKSNIDAIQKYLLEQLRSVDSDGRNFKLGALESTLKDGRIDAGDKEIIAAIIELCKDRHINVRHFLPDQLSVMRESDEDPHLFHSGEFKLTTNPSAMRRLEELTASGKRGVFISHIGDERPIAQHLKCLLEQALGSPVPVFVSSDRTSIKSGKEWYGEILAGLKRSRTVLVLLTPASLNARWINFEAGFGLGSDSDVIPAIARGLLKSNVGAPLGHLQARDLDDANDVAELLNDIAAAHSLLPDISAAVQFCHELSVICHAMPIVGLELLVARSCNDMLEFAIRNNAMAPVDLIDAEVLISKSAVGQGFHFFDALPTRTVISGVVGLTGFRINTTPGGPQAGVNPLPATLTKSMGLRPIHGLGIPLRNDQQFGDAIVRFHVHGTQSGIEASSKLELRLADLRLGPLPT